MVGLDELAQYIDKYLDVNRFEDYAPNGIQVEGRHKIRRVVAGVTACQALIDRAIDQQADLILVHHGYFWRGEEARVVGMKAQRLRALLTNNITLLAYHLPLDAHGVVGNNAQLAHKLGVKIKGMFGEGRVPLAVYGELEEAVSVAVLSECIEKCVERAPLVIEGGPELIKNVGICTGAAQGYIQSAADLKLDAFITGEISESTVHVARERGINFFSAGHHATEKFGVCALGEHLSEKFDLEYSFVDIDNPV